MSKFVRQGNEQFNPRLYNNEINGAGMKTACQSLGSQAKMSGGSSHAGKETYGVKGVSNDDAQLFAGSYAPVKTSKLNQCGAGKKKSSKKKKTTKKKSSKKKKPTKKKSSKKKKTTKKKSSKKKKTTKKKSTKKRKSSKKKATKKKSTKKSSSKSLKRKSLVTKFRNAFGMKGGNSQGHHAGYSPDFNGIAPNNSALANPQSITKTDSCTSPNSYNHYTRVSK